MIVRVSVIIPVYRDWERLALCLEALGRQTLPLDDFDIIVANNESQARELPSSAPANARIVHEPTPGSYNARNTAVARSLGRALAFTDSDCLPDADWLRNGLAVLESSPESRITGPISIFREAGTTGAAFLYDRHMAFPQREYAAAGVCATANLLVARGVFEKVGWFDKRMSGGDFEWNLRAQAAGVPILFRRDVNVAHPARRSVAEIYRKRRRTAGSAALEASTFRFVLGRLRPPIRQLLELRRKGVRWKEVLPILTIFWGGRLAEIIEFSLVRIGTKGPNRS